MQLVEELKNAGVELTPEVSGSFRLWCRSVKTGRSR